MSKLDNVSIIMTGCIPIPDDTASVMKQCCMQTSGAWILGYRDCYLDTVTSGCRNIPPPFWRMRCSPCWPGGSPRWARSRPAPRSRPPSSRVHCKKGYRFSLHQLKCHLPNSHWPGIFKLFPSMWEFGKWHDIPAGDGKIAKLNFLV
jgi:hypothetical protein